eukprot:c1740_g1_i1 orf=54-209(+)
MVISFTNLIYLQEPRFIKQFILVLKESMGINETVEPELPSLQISDFFIYEP